MHHLHPSSKGDQLCPLGFHPQVRWPTRCKRCFRDYKEHGGKRGGDDVAASSPSLQTDSPASKSSSRIWTSTQNLSSSNDNGNGSNNNVVVHYNIELRKRPLSWTSTPDLDEKSSSTLTNKKTSEDVDVSLHIQIPQRRHTTTFDAKELEESFTMRRPPIPPSQTTTATTTTTPTHREPVEDIIILKTDSLAERVRKMNLLKKQNSVERETSRERSVPRKTENENQPSTSSPKPAPAPARPERDSKKQTPSEPTLQSKQSKSQDTSELPKKKDTTSMASVPKKSSSFSSSSVTTNSINKKPSEQTHKNDIDFLLAVKDKNSAQKKHDDSASSMTSDTTHTTIVGPAHTVELKDEIKKLQTDLADMKNRAERAERDKSDLLLRRLASLDTGTNRTAASEALKLQQKVNELKGQVEELKDDKKVLSLKVREMEQDLHNRPAKAVEDDLKRKLQAAEQLCEELMDENSDIKKEIRGIESEMDEMHDSFREDRAVEYSNLKKELDSAMKNCRILSFKLKKSDRKIETLELDKQNQTNTDLVKKVQRLEDDLKLSNELARRLQVEVDQSKLNKNSTSAAAAAAAAKKTPTLGALGKSTSADGGRYSRASLTRGGSQEDPQQLLRDLQDSMEREADLKEQLKFAEEEAESVRKKATRVDDENESLMMQLKKMASRARSRKLSPTPRLAPDPPLDRDEGISDEDDPAELRVLLELNEQEAAILRLKVEDLENETKENKTQIKDLQEKLKSASNSSIKKPLSTLLSSKNSTQTDKKMKVLEDEMVELRKSIVEKDRSIELLQAEITAAKIKKPLANSLSMLDSGNVDAKKQLQVVEQEATILRNKIISLEKENEKIALENKKLLMQTVVRKNSIPNTTAAAPVSPEATNDLAKVKESLFVVEMERDLLRSKLKVMRLESENKLPPRIPKNPTDMITRPTLKKWVEELEDEVYDLRSMLWNCSAEKQTKLENEKDSIEKDLKINKQLLEELRKSSSSKDSSTKLVEVEQKLKKSEEECKKNAVKLKELEDKLKRQEILVKSTDSSKNLIENQLKREKEKLAIFEKDLDKEKKDKQKLETKVSEANDEVTTSKKNLEKLKSTLEKEIKELKAKMGTSKTDLPTSKQLQEIRQQNEELQNTVAKEAKKCSELYGKFESITEENILIKAQLAMEKKNLETEKLNTKKAQTDLTSASKDKLELDKKFKEADKKLKEMLAKNLKSGTSEHEKSMLKNSLTEKEIELDRLKKENEMNIEIVFQLRKDNDDLSNKLNDFERINKVQTSMTDHNYSLETEIKKLRMRLENAELNTKSEVASTRLRYEQQVKNLNVEINAMQRQCERFKKDRDTFKQLLESAQKQIGELKQNSGRQSRSSMHSGDEDDFKGKILFLEQQIGCLEDQLCESRLDSSKFKNQLISERTANEIKISEMTSKLNEYEEDRLIATGRTKIAGMKTKLELSWQKEREEQQRILQETSTLARDLRQTLFEVERERDKERLESKRRLDQLKRSQEEELEEGRKKVSELQCDLLELRDAHAKLRTSNEKLRRERERNERELSKRRMEQDGERKVGALLQTVDELVKIAPDLKIVANPHSSANKNNNLKPDLTSRRSRSPSPNLNGSQISSVLARLAEASEELRRYQQMSEDESERNRVRRGNLRRAASTENDGSSSSAGPRLSSSGKLSRSSNHNGSLIRKSLSLDQTNKQDQSIWRQDDGSMSSMQSIDSELGVGLVRDSDLDSRLSGGSTQSDVPRGPRKKKRGLMGKLRSLTKSGRSAESEGSMQGSDSDVSMSSDIRSSKKDLRNRLSGMFKRSGSTSRSGSTEKMLHDSQQRPVAVTIVGGEDGPRPSSPPKNATLPKPINRTSTVSKPPTPTTPITKRRIIK